MKINEVPYEGSAYSNLRALSGILVRISCRGRYYWLEALGQSPSGWDEDGIFRSESFEEAMSEAQANFAYITTDMEEFYDLKNPPAYTDLFAVDGIDDIPDFRDLDELSLPRICGFAKFKRGEKVVFQIYDEGRPVSEVGSLAEVHVWMRGQGIRFWKMIGQEEQTLLAQADWRWVDGDKDPDLNFLPSWTEE